ncbi:unnamed protein product [Rhizophagus irregularis]|nr:unnamed protein product [Rhizophagus irregularis]
MICEECNKICLAKRFQQNFKNWTSGNNGIDKFIQNTQLSDPHDNIVEEALEWIPYNRFYDIEYIAKGGFGKVYRANWIDGPIKEWDLENENWKRGRQNKFVAPKILDNSKNVTLEFMNEIISHHKLYENDYVGVGVIRFYGITQDLETKNYIMVLDYVKDGSLRNYLDNFYNKLSWYDKIHSLYKIVFGLCHIHNNEIIHRDLHVGNILFNHNIRFNHNYIYITDMGLCKPADYKENTKNKVYGVLPYIAPEVLRGQNYTKASDIYSFGIIMYEVISGLPPYHDLSHDKNLAIKIYANPLNRPTSDEISKILKQWGVDLLESRKSRKSHKLYQTELQKQINETDELSTSNMFSTSLALSYETHSEAIYTSRLLDFNNLPEPKNFDNYYEQYNNITSMEYSGIILTVQLPQENLIETNDFISFNRVTTN